jgi:hypothetical protein
VVSIAEQLRAEAAKCQEHLDWLERHDWPRWLREADTISREITELRRRGAHPAADPLTLNKA